MSCCVGCFLLLFRLDQIVGGPHREPKGLRLDEDDDTAPPLMRPSMSPKFHRKHGSSQRKRQPQQPPSGTGMHMGGACSSSGGIAAGGAGTGSMQNFFKEWGPAPFDGADGDMSLSLDEDLLTDSLKSMSLSQR
jgi:hypothetical protein